MKHFIVETTYLVPSETLAGTLQAHRDYLQIAYERGWCLYSGPQQPRTGGIIVLRAPSLEAVQGFFKDDPYHQKGFASYRFIEFEPVKFQPFLQDWLK